MKRDVRFLHMPSAVSINPALVAALRSSPPWPSTPQPYFKRAEIDQAVAAVRAAPKPYFSKAELDQAAAVFRSARKLIIETEEAK